MTLDIEERSEGGVAVLTLRGRLDSAGAMRLDQRHAPAGERAVVLELSGVDYSSSMGVRSIVALHKGLLRREGLLVLARPTALVERVLKMVGLLSQLRVASSVEDALVIARAALGAAPVETRVANGRPYEVRPLTGRSVLEEWDGGGRLQTVSLEDVGLAFGLAGLGQDAEHARASSGLFASLGGVIGVKPAREVIADFVVTETPADESIHLDRAVAISGTPALVVDGTGRPAIPLAQLAADLETLAGSGDSGLGLLLVGIAPQGRLVFVGLLGPPGALSSPPEGTRIARLNSGHSLLGVAFVLTGESRGLSLDAQEARRSLPLIEELADVVRPSSATPISLTRAWVFRPDAVRKGADKLVAVEVAGGAALREEWKVIVRRLHRDCTRVVLTQLYGGFMSTTFRVTSTDRQGRRQLPSVLKLGPEELTRREEHAHQRYVSTFILNNSTTILGTASEGDWAGLRYNFLGISGPDSHLSWLLDAYVARPVEQVLPLLERLYTRILEPWYGQPIWGDVALYADHDPGRLFPRICADAEALLGISRDDEVLPCPELGIDLPNPFRFLAREYPRRAKSTRRWCTTVTHGDLNLRNVLLDEQDILYVIDFSETRPRSAVADFARLEPILKFELPRLDGPDDLRALLRFEEALQSPSSLEDPPFEFTGDDPFVRKAYEVIVMLRRIARGVTVPEDGIVPYWIGVLEWTFSVLSYVNVSPWRKKYAAYSAALITRRLLALGE